MRRKAGTVKNFPRYFFENRKKKITQAKRGITHSRGSTLVERIAKPMSATPPVNVSMLAPKYEGVASIKNGEKRRAPRKSGKSHMSSFVFNTPIFFEKTDAKITVENVMLTKITALREWVKNMAPDKIVVVARKGTRVNFSLCK